MITFLKILFSAVLTFMCYQVIRTSLESNLFEQWDFLGSIPWMRATLWDFYANVLFIFIWICYKERSVFMKILWLILLVCLGSIATCTYVLIALFRLRKDEGLHEFFTKQL